MGGFDAVAVSIGGMAPTVAMNLNPQQPAQHVGRAVPLVFALCTVLLLLVAWCFAHLAARYPGAGSAYTFVGATFGPRAGLLAGWITLGAYLSFVMVAVAAFGLFGSNILARFPTAPHPSPDVLSMIAAAIIAGLCLTSLRVTGRALMALEGVSILAMVALSVVVLAKVFEGHGPIGDPRIRMVFVPPEGVGVLAIALGATMWLQFRLQPAAMDPSQQQVMAIMPWMMMFVMSTFASGLLIYWATSNCLTIAQQRFLYARHPQLKAQADKDQTDINRQVKRDGKSDGKKA